MKSVQCHLVCLSSSSRLLSIAIAAVELVEPRYGMSRGSAKGHMTLGISGASRAWLAHDCADVTRPVAASSCDRRFNLSGAFQRR